jgi:MtaA/CmuA family methyltransferase
MTQPRQDILAFFSGKAVNAPPLFSGLISVSAPVLEREGLVFHEAHRDPRKLARAAASTYRACGFGSAVVPLDLCVEAEAMGARIDYSEGRRAEYPRVARFLYNSIEQLTAGSAEIAEKINPGSARSVSSAVNQGRIPLVCQAIQLLKEDVGEQVVIGGYLPGPFTLLSLLVETGALYATLRKAPEQAHMALEILTQVLAGAGNAYHAAGADFLTVHEMGGSPGALGPKLYESIVLPQLQQLITALPRPAVLSACGRTNGAMQLLAAAGADALSVDQTNDLAASRAEVPDALLLGNLDPVGLLSQGTPEAIKAAVAGAARSGADAVWPGCDLFLQTPVENLRALAEAATR